jgi:hypothetical protein
VINISEIVSATPTLRPAAPAVAPDHRQLVGAEGGGEEARQRDADLDGGEEQLGSEVSFAPAGRVCLDALAV